MIIISTKKKEEETVSQTNFRKSKRYQIEIEISCMVNGIQKRLSTLNNDDYLQPAIAFADLQLDLQVIHI